MRRKVMLILMGCMVGACVFFPDVTGEEEKIIIFNDNGGWCWFQDERAIIHENKLLVGSVAHAKGTDGSARKGNIEVATYDLNKRIHLGISVLHEGLQGDDHDVPALLVLPDRCFLAVYSKHGNDNLIRYRISAQPGDSTSWQVEQLVSRQAGVTYSNLFRLSAENGGKGRIYNFYRGENWNPNFVISDDNGRTWTYVGQLITFEGRPYVKYASNNIDKIHFITTEHHPQDWDNSIYHAYYKNGNVYKSDGTFIKSLSNGPIRPTDATKVFAGDSNSVAWTSDIHLDDKGHPYIAYSIQKNNYPNDLRYHYARWDGTGWHDFEIAHAGTALYSVQSDYSGLIALDPDDSKTVYISTNSDPVTGQALISHADSRRHCEIFMGTNHGSGAEWTWKPITKNSLKDNIRPIVPKWDKYHTVLLWLRGTYTSYTDYDLAVVGMIDPCPEQLHK